MYATTLRCVFCGTEYPLTHRGSCTHCAKPGEESALPCKPGDGRGSCPQAVSPTRAFLLVSIPAVKERCAWNKGPHRSVALPSHSRIAPAVGSGAFVSVHTRLPHVRGKVLDCRPDTA